ncbi:hypothetical protein IKF23_03465 [Candidatus Saccharibacteria bacterium]|nr:hypothetical protein [Candidatus Saccharibacteria bacterium]
MKRIVKILTVIITAFTFSALFISASTFAQPLPTTVTIKPSLSISIPSSTVSLSLDPSLSSFGYTSSTVTVATNNPNGYKLYIETEDNDEDSSPDTALVNTNNTSYTIPTLPTLSGGYTEDAFIANYWGYRISSGTNTNTDITSTTNYFPYTSNTIINYSNIATNGISSTIDFASKIDYEKPAGQYNIALNFKALPQTTTYYMQDFATDPTLKDTVCTEEPTMVMDKRDGHTYAIAKLADGKCWMVQNLQLGSSLDFHTGTLELTSDDTNTTNSFILTNKRYDTERDNPVMPQASQTIIDDIDGKEYEYYDGSAFFCPYSDAYVPNDFIGCYYNWFTATAGSGTSSITGKDHPDGVDVNDSICPKGWVLPSGGPNGDFQNLYLYYPSASQMLVTNPVTTYNNINGLNKPGFLLSGDYGGTGRAYYIGDTMYALYWSRTTKSNARAYYLFISQSTVWPAWEVFKTRGRAVRCLAQ